MCIRDRPQDVVFTDEDEKSDHARMHNVYGHNMAKATYEGLKQRDGRRPFVITRACYAGTQKYSTAWTGDNHTYIAYHDEEWGRPLHDDQALFELLCMETYQALSLIHILVLVGLLRLRPRSAKPAALQV